MTEATDEVEQRIRQHLLCLTDEQARELARIVERLIAAFRPERVYVFGSQARGDASPDSDVDLLVVVPHSAEGLLAAWIALSLVTQR